MAAPLPKLKLRTNVTLPAQVNGGRSIAVTKANGIYTFDFDPSDIVQLPSVTEDQFPFTFVLSFNSDNSAMALLPFNIAVTDKLTRIITEPGDVNIGPNDGLIILNKTIPESTNIIFPASGTKSGACEVIDFAGNAGTYNFTASSLDAGDKFNGQTTFKGASNGVAVVFDPIGGLGYGVTSVGAVSNHAVAVGKGAGIEGFTSVSPGTAGYAFISNGPSSDGSFQAIAGASFGAQTANRVWAGPASGSAAVPTFRALVGADLPLPGASALGSVFSLAATSNNFLTGLGTDGNFTRAQPSASNLSNGVTGSGSVVLATSPTLVTPALGTPSSVTLTNGVGLPTTGLTGTLQAAQEPAHAGDVTNSAGSLALAIGATKVTSAMLNSDVFSTAHSWGGQQTFTAPILGTPASGVATNLTGTAAGLTAGNVTTNANLTGDVTSVGNATTLTNAPVIAKVLTGYTSGAGTISSADSILSAIQKLNGNNATNANLTGDVTSVGNSTTLAAGNAGSLNAGTLLAARMPALTGDITTSAGAVATTLATVNSNVGTFGSATQAAQVTVNAKGLATAAANVTITPAVGSITGLGTGVATALATPSSANLAAAITDETGSGALVFGTAPTLSQPLIVGVTTNSSASAGNVGEYISSSVVSGSAVALTSNTAKTVTSISLTAGDWDVTINAQFLLDGTTSLTQVFSSLSLTTNTLDTTPGQFNSQNYPAFIPGSAVQSAPIGPVRVSLASTTTIYFVGRATFSISTVSGYGLISARRPR